MVRDQTHLARTVGPEPEIPNRKSAGVAGEIASEHLSGFHAAEIFRSQFFHSHAAQSLCRGRGHPAANQSLNRALRSTLDPLRTATNAKQGFAAPGHQFEL